MKDLDAAKKFYRKTLGLKQIFEMPGWAEFSHAEGNEGDLAEGLMRSMHDGLFEGISKREEGRAP